MSKIEKEVRLSPPACLQPGRKPEVLVSTRHTCPYCHGNGFYFDAGPGNPYNNEYNSSIRHGCPVCLGSGMLDARITVQWVPSKDEDDGKGD